MINIAKLTTYELERRLDSLPENLAKLATSKTTEQAVELICADNNLRDQNKVLAVKQVVALSILGFIHIYDLASEINSGAGLNNPPLSKDIASSIEAKIFAQLKDEVEKNYNPTLEENELESIVEDLGNFDIGEYESSRPAPTISSPEAETARAPKPIDSLSAISPSKTDIPPVAGPGAAAPVPKVNPFSFLGNASVAPSPMPKTTEPVKPEPISPPRAPTPSKPTPGPFVIHAENKEPQIVQAPKFKLETSGTPLSAFGLAGKAASTPRIPKPAQIEIGREEKLKPVEKISKFESSPKAIHYSSLSSPITLEGAPKSGAAQQQKSFGNIAPMPTGKPASPVGGPAEPAAKPVPIVPSRPFLPKAPPAAKPASPTPVQTKNPLAQPQATPPSFGGLVKNMISPEESKSEETPPPPAPAR